MLGQLYDDILGEEAVPFALKPGAADVLDDI